MTIQAGTRATRTMRRDDELEGVRRVAESLEVASHYASTRGAELRVVVDEVENEFSGGWDSRIVFRADGADHSIALQFSTARRVVLHLAGFAESTGTLGELTLRAIELISDAKRYTDERFDEVVLAEVPEPSADRGAAAFRFWRRSGGAK